ncbi:DUF551 domain-containing protein [Atlantibacter hermannii]|uniref:DUF551 domain-containing protein n=1 Tax=Atlantibacter hermannii TaxID=565 RepID=UPI002899711C|nr:DUF551 domain-containing protein [Atlantibacter hermannii]
MTINERVSPERLAHIRASYEASRKGYAFIGHPSYNESIAIISELQQYRAAAEPVCPKCGGTGMADSGGFYPWGEPIFIECDCKAAPQVTSVPDEILSSMEEVLRISDRDHEAWDRAKSAITAFRSAPAAQADRLSGNTEQVSQPALPETITRNDADGWWMYKGRRVGGGCAEWYNRALGDCRAAIASGNSPAIPDGWIPVSERMPDETQPVIVVADGGVVQRTVYQFCDGVWIDWYEQYDEVPHDAFTHWMPLPAAPKQEDE